MKLGSDIRGGPQVVNFALPKNMTLKTTGYHRGELLLLTGGSNCNLVCDVF